MEAVELAVEAKLLDENSHNGCSIQVTIPQVGFSLVKPCFLPINRLTIMSIVCSIATWFTVVSSRFLKRNMVRRVK